MIRRRSASISPSPAPSPSTSTSRSPSSSSSPSPSLTPNGSRRPTVISISAPVDGLNSSTSSTSSSTPNSLITRIFKKNKPRSVSSSPPLQPVIGTPRELPTRARALTHDDIDIDIDDMTTLASGTISMNISDTRSRSASAVTPTSTSTPSIALASSAWNVSSISGSGSVSASASPSTSSRSLNRISSHHERTISSHHAPTSEHLQAPSHASHTRTRSQIISPHPAMLYHDCESETFDHDSEPPASSRPHPLIRPRSASLRTVAAAPVPTSHHPFTVSSTLPGKSWEQEKSLNINKKEEYGHQREKDSQESLLAQDPDVPPLML